jgi:hypothetical protein
MLAVILVAVGILAECGSQEAPDSSGTEEVGERADQQLVSLPEPTGGVERSVDATIEETSQEQPCSEEEDAESRGIRIGDFEPPEEEVPQYKILEEEPVERGCVRAIRFLVDTQARSEADYTLITRELKSEYQYLDALSLEFVDASASVFSYNGAAVIFNNTRGARFVGYFHHPPSNEGYHVSAAKD